MADTPNYKGRRFLVVDDEDFMRNVVVQILRSFGAVDIATADDGRAALAKAGADHKRYDCIICDFNMKPVNGLMLLKAIRSGRASAIPTKQAFIMLTGHGEVDVVKTAVQLDVNGYLVKPVPADKLAAALDRILDKDVEVKDPSLYAKVSLGAVDLDENGNLSNS